MSCISKFLCVCPPCPTNRTYTHTHAGHQEILSADFPWFCSLRDLIKIMNTNPLTEQVRVIDNRVRTEDDSSAQRTSKYVKFISDREFVERWYLDPKKTALDLLYQLSKFRKRFGWSHEMILHHGRFPFPDMGSNDERGDIGMVIFYSLHGLKRLTNRFSRYRDLFIKDCHTGLDQLTSRVVGAVKVIERSKTEPVANVVNDIHAYKRPPVERTCPGQKRSSPVKESWSGKKSREQGPVFSQHNDEEDDYDNEDIGEEGKNFDVILHYF